MQILAYVLYQLDEARRYILGGRLEQLRLALLLLDNAAEVQLDQRVREELSLEDRRDEWTAFVGRVAPELLPDHRETSLGGRDARTPLTKKKRGEIYRYFDAKLAYLSDRREVLDPRLVAPLCHLHHYRNEAFHQAHVRPETIRTAAQILLEINCQLLGTVYTPHAHSGDDDCTWLEHRFGIRPILILGNPELLSMIADSLRFGIIGTTAAMTESLSNHIRSRLTSLEETLEGVRTFHGCADTADALRLSEYYAALESGATQPHVELNAFTGKRSPDEITAILDRALELAGIDDRLEAFRAFSEIEQSLEFLEASVRVIAGYMDRWVSDEVDRRRGK